MEWPVSKGLWESLFFLVTMAPEQSGHPDLAWGWATLVLLKRWGNLVLIEGN